MEQWLKELDCIIIAYKKTEWDKDKYGFYLAQTYHYVKYSTRLLAYASSKLPLSDNKNFYGYIRHLWEEKEHEILAKNDLYALGYDLDTFEEYSVTKAFYQCQVFYINQNPYIFLGYIFALELLATQMCSWFQEYASKKFGENTTSFMRVHASDDVNHIKKVYEIISSLDEDVKMQVWNNFKQTHELLLIIVNKSIKSS